MLEPQRHSWSCTDKKLVSLVIVLGCSDKDIQKLCYRKARRVETNWYWCTQRDATAIMISRLNGENKAKCTHIITIVAWQELLMDFPGL